MTEEEEVGSVSPRCPWRAGGPPSWSHVLGLSGVGVP